MALSRFESFGAGPGGSAAPVGPLLVPLPAAAGPVTVDCEDRPLVHVVLELAGDVALTFENVPEGGAVRVFGSGGADVTDWLIDTGALTMVGGNPEVGLYSSWVVVLFRVDADSAEGHFANGELV